MGSIGTAIPKGSLVLVTGVNGFVGSHVADQFLAAGYRVRGTARDLHKTDGLGELWKQKYGQDSVEFVQVTNMSNEGAFDEAVKGIYHLE
jgi:nucleoside-diphosphate-sugar epimerase